MNNRPFFVYTTMGEKVTKNPNPPESIYQILLI